MKEIVQVEFQTILSQESLRAGFVLFQQMQLNKQRKLDNKIGPEYNKNYIVLIIPSQRKKLIIQLFTPIKKPRVWSIISQQTFQSRDFGIKVFRYNQKMIDDTKNLQIFYHDQNIQIRKQIRQMDMQFKQTIENSKNSSTSKQQQALRQQINFLVIGPAKSGKSSLIKQIFPNLRTMYFALNSNFNAEITFSELPGTVIKRIDVKKNKKYQIEGLVKMKQTDQKKTITAFQFQDKPTLNQSKQLSSQQKSSKVFQKYSNALQLIDNRVFGCFKTTYFSNSQLFNTNQSKNQTSSPFLSIRTVLIVLNILTKIQFEEISCMKFFLVDIREKGIKTLIILTHIDRLNHLKENDKLILIEERIDMLSKELDIKDRDDFICVQNYHELGKSSTTAANYGSSGKNFPPENRSQINFQNPKKYQKIYQQKPFCHQNRSSFQYKKVSESFISDASLQMEIPVIGKHQRPSDNSQKNIQNPAQNNMNVSGTFSWKTTQDHSYAKVSAKNISTQNSIPQTLNQKGMNKKGPSINYQPINQGSHQPSSNKHDQILSIKNSQEINYYSLKLLIKIFKQSQKYLNRELKHKKIIKWFCG